MKTIQQIEKLTEVLVAAQVLHAKTMQQESLDARDIDDVVAYQRRDDKLLSYEKPKRWWRQFLKD